MKRSILTSIVFCLFALCFAGEATAAPPTMGMSYAVAPTYKDATAQVAVNANNSNTVVTFQFGTTTNYGQVATASPSPITGGSYTGVIATLPFLNANTTYHFRAVATNALGQTSYGFDSTFTTLVPDYAHVIYNSIGHQTIIGNGKALRITAKGFLVLSADVTLGYPVKATAIVGFTLNGLKLYSVVPLENYRWDLFSGPNGSYTTMAKAESPGTQFDGVLLEAVYLRGKNTSLDFGFMPRTFTSSARSIGLNSQTGAKTLGEVAGSYVYDRKATITSNQLETYDQAVTRLSNGFAGRGYTQFSPTPAQ